MTRIDVGMILSVLGQEGCGVMDFCDLILFLAIKWMPSKSCLREDGS